MKLICFHASLMQLSVDSPLDSKSPLSMLHCWMVSICFLLLFYLHEALPENLYLSHLFKSI